MVKAVGLRAEFRPSSCGQTRTGSSPHDSPGNRDGAARYVLRSWVDAEISSASIPSSAAGRRSACAAGLAREPVRHPRSKSANGDKSPPPSSRLLPRVHRNEYDLEPRETLAACPHRATEHPKP